MNDMQKLFTEHEKTAGPPLGLDTDELARKGRKRLAARRVSAVGGLGAVIAVIAVAAVTLTSLASPAPADQAADDAEQPDYPLPDLPDAADGYRYAWNDTVGTDKTSTAATAYGESFQDWFADNGIELGDWPGMTINKRVLYYGHESDNKWDLAGAEVPFYGIRIDKDNAVAALTKAGLVPYGQDDTVSLKVHPRGSFKPGAGDIYEHLATCTDDVNLDALEQADGVDYTCDEATGPNGELMLRQHTVLTDDVTRVEVNRVVHFRADGTAVVVDDRTKANADSGPKLSLDELTDLALSMPDDIVED